MKITFLGTSHGMTEKNAFCAAAVVSIGERHYVIDAGAPLGTLLQNYDIPFSGIRAIFITHPHHDHFLGLVDLSSLVEGFRFQNVSIDVYHPEGVPIAKMYDFLYDGKIESQDSERLHYHLYQDAKPDGDVIFDDGVLKVTAIPVEPYVPHSHAFLLEAEGKKVLFSGDLHKDMPDYPAVLEQTDTPFDLVVVEAAHSVLTGEPVMAHFRATKTKRLIIQHRNPRRNTDEMMKEVAADLAPLYPVFVIGDGYSIEL